MCIFIKFEGKKVKAYEKGSKYNMHIYILFYHLDAVILINGKNFLSII